MKGTMYNQLVQINENLKFKKQKLRNVINDCNAKIEIIEQMMLEIESVLTDKGKHIYEHYEEEVEK